LARKVLLADDSVTAQNMGRKILADAGYEVVTVNNGSAALKKITEIRPDLVVLDIYMPGYSGLEVCQRLKESADTADLPVLLTVGKLEPFKPEEAQRVRADAFIVKPFEASELLGTLSKLEDKVVPRGDGTKTGRLARAVSRIDADRKDESESTWRDRIKFPTARKEVEEQSPDDGALYNPMNRDLRTVIDRPTTPAGLPVDATAEELAALAAAASKLSLIESASSASAQSAPAQAGGAVSEAPISMPVPEPEPQPVEAAEPSAPAPEVMQATVEAGAPINEPRIEATTEAAPESRDIEPAELPSEKDVQAAIASLSPLENEIKASVDVPVTMAVAHEQTAIEPRWMAVAVAPSVEEAGLSLEREMEKAYAAYAAAGATSAAGAVPAPPQPNADVANPQRKPQPNLAMAAASQIDAEPAIHAEAVSATPETHTETTQAEFRPQESHQPLTAIAPAAQEATAAAESIAEAASVSAEVAQDHRAAGQNSLPKPPANQKEDAALAVAAGAERLMEEAKAAAPGADSSAIASIVESVMAELRPKLVEEIARKLAAERK